MMWGYGGGATVWWVIVESLIWVLVVAAMVVGVAVLMRGGLGHEGGSDSTDPRRAARER